MSVGSGDDADDIAIWVNPVNPSRSLIIAGNKANNGGIAVYDLTGKELQYLDTGSKIGNIDLRQGFPLNGEQATIVAAGQRSIHNLFSLLKKSELGRMRWRRSILNRHIEA